MKSKYRIAAVSSILFLLVFLAVAIFVYVSHDDSELGEQSVYTCPMHPEVVSEKPADCPDCGMDLVKTSMAEGKQYTCPMHPEVISEKPGDCPDCGMPLVEKPGIAEGQYTCPMHPEVVSDKHGDCPDCGMPLVEKAGHSEMNHQETAKIVVKKVRKAKRNKSSEAGKQYVCSMHPQVIRDIPGDCPICGMFLIELIALDDNKYDSSMTDIVRPVTKSVLASVRTVVPEQMSLPVVIEASGIVSYDPRRIQTVSARFGGVIEKSFVRYQFQYIRKGDKIFEIFAPNIYDDRWNYVRLIQTYPDREDLTAEALEWFRLIGLSKGQIDTLKKTIRPDYYFAVYSPADGYAVSLDLYPAFSAVDEKERDTGGLSQGYGGVGLTDGKSVGTGEPLFRLADVSALLVELKVKTQEGSLLRRGQKVTLNDPLIPDRNLTGDIDQVEPLNGGIFQSVRIYIRDEGRILSPGRQVQANIAIGRRDGLWVPASAVVNLGTRRTVMVRNDNKFIPVEVATGVESAGKIEILSGIEATSEIAEKALLLIDSDGFITPGQVVTGENILHRIPN